MTSLAERAADAANRAIAEAVGATYARREFTISKFGIHENGYLHARVVVKGKPYYFTRRHGSWLAPGHADGRAVEKEPEALLGSILGQEVKFALSEKSYPYDKARRKAREEAARHDRPAANYTTTDDDRLPEEGDHLDPEAGVQPVGG